MTAFGRTIPALPVTNIRQSTEFYDQKFGFTARHSEDGFAIVCRGDAEIHLWAANDERWQLYLRGVLAGSIRVADPISVNIVNSGAETFLAGTASCRVEVHGIDELYDEYKQAGVLHSPGTVVIAQRWGDRDFPTLDLCGNLLTFFEPG